MKNADAKVPGDFLLILFSSISSLYFPQHFVLFNIIYRSIKLFLLCCLCIDSISPSIHDKVNQLILYSDFYSSFLPPQNSTSPCLPIIPISFLKLVNQSPTFLLNPASIYLSSDSLHNHSHLYALTQVA